MGVLVQYTSGKWVLVLYTRGLWEQAIEPKYQLFIENQKNGLIRTKTVLFGHRTVVYIRHTVRHWHPNITPYIRR